jgi:hypothetical protein
MESDYRYTEYSFGNQTTVFDNELGMWVNFRNVTNDLCEVYVRKGTITRTRFTHPRERNNVIRRTIADVLKNSV